jgi:CheY-like chemotaxis protein
MTIVICNENEQNYFERVFATFVGEQSETASTFVCDGEDLAALFSLQKEEPNLIIVEAGLEWSTTYSKPFYGFNIAAALRRNYLVKAPIILCSSLEKGEFENLEKSDGKYRLLKAKGTGFVSLPCSKDAFHQQVFKTEPLDDESLRKVIVEHCGLREDWRLISHTLGSLLTEGESQNKEVQRIVGEWSISINKFAADQKDNLRVLQKLLNRPPSVVKTSDLKRALEALDDGLQDRQVILSDVLKEYGNHFPKCPPKGFSRILIADDESQHFLADSLRHQYGYDVITQAYKLSQAKELLNKEKPDVVLSDYYFKESSRKTELPDKSIGDRFIQYALTHPQYADTDPKKPLVLVTSKATLQPETEIRAGAINCSGANRATDPQFIHTLIWAEARKRGVSEQEKIWGQEWSLEHTCRLRLEQYVKDITKLMRRWSEFNQTVRDTLTLCRLLYRSPTDDDPVIVQRVISLLEPYEGENSFSFGTVVKIFAETDCIQKSAQQPPHSQAKQAIRNILHGRIEQFSSVTNAVRFLITSIRETARDLTSLVQYRHYGEQLNSTLREYSESEPLLPILTSLNENLRNAVADLPPLPSSPLSLQSRRSNTDGKNINIVIVEDNEYWRDFVIGAIEATKSRLGENLIISYEYFDNAADALASIPSTSQSFGIDGDYRNDSKTIAIVDICLPENHDEAESIQAALKGKSDQFASPHSTHGFNLILNLCKYNYNIPLIIFSTLDSIGDRKTIGSWGVPDEDFLVKGVDDENAMVRALIRKIEKKTKYVVKRFEDEEGNIRFRINGIGIPFPKELAETFSALYRLAQATGRNEFSVTEIFEAREKSLSSGSKKTIQDQMYRIRNLILETLRANHVYVDVRELIRTNKSSNDDGGYNYQFTAEVIPLEEEEDYESDLKQYEQETCRVLVIEDNSQTLGEIIEPLESLGYEVRYATNVEDAVKEAVVFFPHIISLDLHIPYHPAETEAAGITADEFGGLEAWRQIRLALSEHSLGIVVPTINIDRDGLVTHAAQMEIPIRNFISKTEATWLNLFLKKIADEKRRVFLGQVTDAGQDISEPIVEILDGSDLSEGVLRLIVNSEPFTMKKSPLAKIIGLLLASPKTLRSFETIKTALGSGGPVTRDDSKNWTKRIRGVIKKEWLKSSQNNRDNLEDLSKKILESSVRGLRLNVHVIDSRRK